MSKTPTILVFFFKFLLAALHIYLRAECEMSDSLLPIRLIPAPARLALLLGTCTRNQVMRADVWWSNWNRAESVVISTTSSQWSEGKPTRAWLNPLSDQCERKKKIKSCKINPHSVSSLRRRSKATRKTTKLKRYSNSHLSQQNPSLRLIFLVSINNEWLIADM